MKGGAAGHHRLAWRYTPRAQRRATTRSSARPSRRSTASRSRCSATCTDRVIRAYGVLDEERNARSGPDIALPWRRRRGSARGGSRSAAPASRITLTVDRRRGLGQDRGRADCDAATSSQALLIRPRNARAQGIGRSAPKGRHRDCAYRRGYGARGLRNQPGAHPPDLDQLRLRRDQLDLHAGRQAAPPDDRPGSPSGRTTSAPHYIFNSGIGWSLPHWGAATSTTRTPTAGRSTTSPSPTRCTTRSCGAGHAAAGGARLHAARARPRRRRAAVRVRAEPHAVEPVRGRALVVPAQGLCEVGRAGARAGRALRGRATARRTSAGGSGSSGTSPTSPTGAAPPEQFHALYDVTAAAVKAALPDAPVGGPATTGDLGPGPRGQGVPARLPRPLRPATARRSTSSPSTPRARASPVARVRADRWSGARAAVAVDPQDAARGPGGARAVAAHPTVPRPAVHRRRVRRLGPRALGRLRQRELRLPQHRVLPGLPVQADEEAARPRRDAEPRACTRRPRGASTSRASATSRAREASSPPRASRSRCSTPTGCSPASATAPGRRLEPCLAAGRLDDGEAGMPEEIDALATFNGRTA